MCAVGNLQLIAVSIKEFSQPIPGHTNLQDDTDQTLVIVDAFK
jgi:hypothetical protein